MTKYTHTPERKAYDPNSIRPSELQAKVADGLDYQLSQARGFVERLSGGGDLAQYDSFSFKLYYPESGKDTGKSVTVTKSQLLEAYDLLEGTTSLAGEIFAGNLSLKSAPEYQTEEDGYIHTQFDTEQGLVGLSCRPRKQNYGYAVETGHFNGEEQVKIVINGVTYRVDCEYHHETDFLLGVSLDIGEGFLRREKLFMDDAIGVLGDPGNKNYGNALVGALLSLASAVSVEGVDLHSQDDASLLEVDPRGPHPGHHYQMVDLTGASDRRLIPNAMGALYGVMRPNEIIEEVGRLELLKLGAKSVIRLALDRMEGTRRSISIPGLLRALGVSDPEFDQLKRRADRDALTGLKNRYAIDSAISAVNEMLNSNSASFQGLAITYFDAIDFGKINKQHGQPSGDEALQAIANHLDGVTRKGDVVIRMGGDEFVVISPIRTQRNVEVDPDDLPDIFLAKASGIPNIKTQEGIGIEIKLRGGFAYTPEQELKSAPDLSNAIEVLIRTAAEDLIRRKNLDPNQQRLFEP